MKKITYLSLFFLILSGICLASVEKLSSPPNKGKEFMSDFNMKLGLTPDIISKKNKLMKRSVLSFYRASPHLFYSDIFSSYKKEAKLLPNPPLFTVNGDIHIGNFGTLKSPDGQVVWGINDFDLCFKGNPEWDLGRYAVSLILQAREMGLSEEEQKELVLDFSNTYFETAISISKDNKKVLTYLSEKNSPKVISKLIKKSKTKKQLEYLEKYVDINYLDYKFDNKNLSPIPKKLSDSIEASLRMSFKNIKKIHCISERKESGGSTYGLKRYWALVSVKELPSIVEIKQILPNPYDDLTGDLKKADAKAIIEAQSELGGVKSSFSSNTSVDGYSYIIREREAVKGDVNLKKLDYLELKELNRQCAIVIASSHCYKQNNRKAIEAWLKNKQNLASKLYNFSFLYANQTEVYFENF